ncbi:MAG: hypothetical protein WAW75_01395 [Gallionella sp.]
MPRDIFPESLPILTETADGTPLDLPILMETVEEPLTTTAHALLLTDAQCHQLAEQLLPKIEVTLLDAINSSPESDWQSAMQQVRAHLPALIRKVLQELR